MIDIDQIACDADVIIDGFAVLRQGPWYKVVNLNNGKEHYQEMYTLWSRYSTEGFFRGN